MMLAPRHAAVPEFELRRLEQQARAAEAIAEGYALDLVLARGRLASLRGEELQLARLVEVELVGRVAAAERMVRLVVGELARARGTGIAGAEETRQ